MTIKFAGNDNYAPINVTKTVTVNDDRIKTILSATSKTLYLTIISKGYSYKVTFKDMNGKAIANKKISFKIDGKTYSATTSSTGIANIKIKATTTGNKKATISFKGDDKYAPVTKTLTVKVIKQSSKISAYKKTFKVKIKTKKYTITLKNNKGKAIYKGTVYIKVKGKTYKAVTNSKGKATFKITKLTKKGKFTATIKYYGNKYYSSTSKQVLIRTRR
ncbi:Ig-like domain repeat protein [Methanobrevibacter gottschalkii]